MKAFFSLVLMAQAALNIAASLHMKAETAKSPISKVVQLLLNLQTKLEGEFKSEEDLWEKYDCWYKSVKNSKTSSNNAAKARIDSLTSYIEDVDAGRIEFTTERVDLEKQVADLKQDLATAENLRAKEKDDFLAAKDEMEKAITALDSAVEVLEDGMEALVQTKRANLLSIRSDLREAVHLALSFLSKGDAKLLEAVVEGRQPIEKDWKKLNRKAEFKSKYTGRSDKIVDMLKGLKRTFSTNLEEAEAKEAEAEANYNTLKESKGKMLSEAEAALESMVEENGARGLSKEQSQAEIDDLTKQITNDNMFIQEAETAHASKEQEWTERKKLRTEEITAISEAIQVLHNDDARDTFHKSYSLLQTSQDDRHGTWDAARGALMAVSRQDSRIAQLVRRLDSGDTSSIQLVINSIDNIIENLEAEETQDLNKKESCETSLASTAQQARMTSLDIDSSTEAIVRAKSKIEEITAEIAEQNASIAELREQIEDITRQREDETKEYNASKVVDQQAVALIERAVTILSDWKQEENQEPSGPTLLQANPMVHKLAVVAAISDSRPKRTTASHIALASRIGHRAQSSSKHTGTSKQPVEVEAGLAPPPPPATWEDPAYGGAESESKGILSILDLLKMDIEKDISEADTAEQEAQTEFESQKSALEASITSAQEAVQGYKQDRAGQEQEVVDSTNTRITKNGQLKSTMEQHLSLKPGCDYILVNFNVRVQKRNVEMDGLKSAKAILQTYVSGASPAPV